MEDVTDEPPVNTTDLSAITASEDPESFEAIAKQTCLAWERLRIVYVAVLGGTTLLFTPVILDHPLLIFSIAFGAVFANLCFFAGPAVETYVRWLGYRELWVRKLLFLSGTFFAWILAVGTLAAPIFDFD